VLQGIFDALSARIVKRECIREAGVAWKGACKGKALKSGLHGPMINAETCTIASLY